jgi:hypothetical protein
MKIGDKVTYKVGGLTHNGTIVWISSIWAIVQTEQGTRDQVDLTELKLQ